MSQLLHNLSVTLVQYMFRLMRSVSAQTGSLPGICRSLGVLQTHPLFPALNSNWLFAKKNPVMMQKF